MAATPPDSAGLDLVLAVRASAAASSGGAEHEPEVLAIFDQLRGPLLRYALAIGLRIPEAEDIVQEVFLALFRHTRLGRPRDNLRGWVFRVAHNLALKHREAARREVQHGAGSPEMPSSEPAHPGPGPEEQLAHSERHARLRAVLRALPEQDRQCLYLRAEGLRYREIAGVLGMSLGAVSLSLTRSLARMRRADGG
ncbi:MAG TPA: sigma-70 family RNA polymerase sigma factor [Bryobacteraceae bacterium]|nr:sigma-70 family RNA polymerase sigma factor [Bryobacteraceae bacterium]